MIHLLGGSGHVGCAYQAMPVCKVVAFRNLRRAKLDHTNPATPRDGLRRDKPDFLINAADYAGRTHHQRLA